MKRAETLFISDLHLSATRPELVAAFEAFLTNRAASAEALFILGDLFDAYIGDDDVGFPFEAVRSGLRRVSAGGTRVFFMAGNRDFLVGSRFSEETGAVLLGDYHVIDLYGIPTLLTHGDLLCTDDHRYQQARLRVRNDAWKARALAKPLFVRRLYARWYRYKSSRQTGMTAAEIMDVNESTVHETLARFGVPRLIHGHTHRQAVHDLRLRNGLAAQRFVLAEWIKGEPVLSWTPDGYRFETVHLDGAT